MRKIKFLINNCWVEALEKKYFSVYNPYDKSKAALAAEASAADVERAALSARMAAKEWAALSVQERCGYLLKAAEILKTRLKELARAETEQTGKPIYESENIDMPLVVKAFEYYGKNAPSMLRGQEQIQMDDDSFEDYISYEPYGVTGIIAPWNFPLHLLTRDMCPALAAGNTVVAKPSSKTPVTAALLGEILLEAGFPAGVVNIIYGSGEVAGEALARSENIDIIAFTGSEEAGRKIMRASSEASVIKKMIMELGGKGAICVDRDGDLEGAVSSAVYGVCMNQGEVCCASSRCYVHEDIYERFLKEAVNRMKELVLGDPFDERTDMGSLIDEEQLRKVEGYVQRAIASGAVLVTGGKRSEKAECISGSFYEPTILTGVTENMECMEQEIFGPVLIVVKVKSLKEAVERANMSKYGLGAAVWSESEETLAWASKALQAGTVWQNHNITSTLEAPYGGIKNSGFGRQYSSQGLLEYVYIKNNMRYRGKPYFDFYRDKYRE